MIDLNEKKVCCGCGACAQSCPKGCIRMLPDDEGFLYPQVDESSCIHCGICEKICPFKNTFDEQRAVNTYAVINGDESIRLTSSSGGVFTALAQQFLKRNGVVFGACFDEDFQVSLSYVENEASLHIFKGSKYVQARVGDCYVQCRKFLNDNREVLFSGTPCQISGLKHFLKKDYDNLYTVDVVCHGSPSPLVWKKYLEECLKKKPELFPINNISFRDKRNGWKGFSLTIEGHNSVFSTPYKNNPYMRAFLWDLILRPSCYECKAKAGTSLADLTLGDFWGIDRIIPSIDDNKGVSLVVVNSKKGGGLLESARELNVFKVNYDDAAYYNPAIIRSVKPHPKRNLFFKKIHDEECLEKLVLKCLKPSFVEQFMCVLKKVYHKFLKGPRK